MKLVEKFLKAGAQLPPVLKSRSSMRVFSFLLRKLKKQPLLTTNLGIDPHFKFRFDSQKDTSPILAFGKPSLYRGERGALHLAAHLLQHCSAFLDVGANYGYFSYFLSVLEKNKPFYLFEPNPRLFKIILRTTKENSLTHVTSFQQAVGKEKGRTSFLINLDDECQSSLRNDANFIKNFQKIEVDIISIDHFIHQNPKLHNLLVKVDIENAEFDFLEGAINHLDRISFLVIEVLLPALKQNFIPTLINQYGFQAYYIEDFNLHYSQDGSFVYQQGELNWLFCRHPPESLSQLLKGTKFKII
jgi:FkbM family methyltransferase